MFLCRFVIYMCFSQTVVIFNWTPYYTLKQCLSQLIGPWERLVIFTHTSEKDILSISWETALRLLQHDLTDD